VWDSTSLWSAHCGCKWWDKARSGKLGSKKDRPRKSLPLIARASLRQQRQNLPTSFCQAGVQSPLVLMSRAWLSNCFSCRYKVSQAQGAESWCAAGDKQRDKGEELRAAAMREWAASRSSHTFLASQLFSFLGFRGKEMEEVGLRRGERRGGRKEGGGARESDGEGKPCFWW